MGGRAGQVTESPELSWRRAQLAMFRACLVSVEETLRAVRDVRDFMQIPARREQMSRCVSQLVDEQGDLVEQIETLERAVRVLEEGGDPEEVRPQATVIRIGDYAGAGS